MRYPKVGDIAPAPMELSRNGDYDDEIRYGMARALWVTAYADAVEDDPDLEEMGYPAAGPGEDWVDVAPMTPPSAESAAFRLSEMIERANGVGIDDLFGEAAIADGVTVDDLDAEEFGHYLAMQALGHGVSWFDDHATFGIEIPHFEAHVEQEDDGRLELFYSGMHMNPRSNALTEDERDDLPRSKFAMPEMRKLPIPDASHVRNAMARFNQVKGATRAQKRSAYRRIMQAARRYGIDADDFAAKYGVRYG